MSTIIPPEEWKQIHGYEGLYEISNEGKVRKTFKTGKTKICMLRQTIAKSKIVHLSKKNKKKQFMISKLVFSHFTPDWDFSVSPRQFTLRHYDENPMNCNILNLMRNQDDMFTHRPERVNKMETEVDKWVASRPYVGYFYDSHGTKSIRFRRTWDPQDGRGKRQIDKTLKYDPSKQTNRVNRTFFDIRYAYRTWLIKNKMFKIPKAGEPKCPLNILSQVNTNVDKKAEKAMVVDEADMNETTEFIDEAKEALENKLIVENWEKRPSKIGHNPEELYSNEDFVEDDFSE